MPLIDARTRVRIVVSFVLMLSSYSSNEHPCASRIFFFSTLFFVKYSVLKKTQDVTATRMTRASGSRALANQK